MRIQVTETQLIRHDLPNKPVEVVHDFPGTMIPEHHTLVVREGAELHEGELAYARALMKHHVTCCLEFEYEVRT